jgi:exopolysaccharide biosynthesis polyprenyl glycosylphosphotransferase
MNRRRRTFVTNILVALDALVILITYLLTYLLRNQLYRVGLETLASFSYYFPFLLWILFIWLVLLRIFNCYSLTEGQGLFSRGQIVVKLILVEALGLAIISAFLFFFQEGLSRTFLLFFGFLNFLVLSFFKLTMLAYFAGVNRNKKYHRKVLVLGSKPLVDQFIAVQQTMPELFFDPELNPAFLFPPGKSPSKEKWKTLNEDVLQYIMDHVIDEVLLCFRNLDLSLAAPLINECRHLGIMANFIFDTSEIYYPKTEVDKIGPFNIVSFQSYDYSPWQRFFKRLMDLSGGLVGSFAFLVLYIFLAPLIKFSSPGPVLFVQTRKGKNGREFKLLKFRTMYKDAEERKKEFLSKNEMRGHIFKLANDPRITPLGKFLRKTSLDEFPQFVNILKGDMSLVGTRPPTVEEFEAYETRHRRRLSIRPGLTGLWQVSGRNRINDFEDIVKLDTAYIDNWSIWLDIKIILKTFTVFFKGH